MWLHWMYSQHFILFATYQQVECMSSAGLSSIVSSNTHAYWAHSYVKMKLLWLWLQWLYSQHFIFFVIYEWAL